MLGAEEQNSWIGDQLSLELLGTGISLAELVLAVVGLWAGGFTAGRASALARMRVEDRRELGDDLLNFLDETHFPGGEGQELDQERLVAWKTSWERAQRLVSLLSWTERSAWSAIERKSPMELVEKGLRQVNASGMLKDQDVDTSADGIRGQWYDEFHPSGFESDWCKSVASFNKNLDRHLRPTFGRRTLRWWYTGGRVVEAGKYHIGQLIAKIIPPARSPRTQ